MDIGLIQIICAGIGAIALPLYFIWVRRNTDHLETVQSYQKPRSPIVKGLAWFLTSVCGGVIGWAIGKGLDKLFDL